MKKLLSFEIDEERAEDFKQHVLMFESAKIYEPAPSHTWNNYEDAGSTFLRYCSDGEYDNWCYECACNTLDEIFTSMEKSAAEQSVLFAYEKADWVRIKDNIFSVVSHNYEKYKYEDILRRMIDLALKETDIDHVCRAEETALEYFESDYRPELEKMEPFDSRLGMQFWNQILHG